MELREDELAFALLDEGLTLGCNSLYNLIVEAVKATFPNDWMDKICSCFTIRTRFQVEKVLESSRPLTDIYAVCKIIRRRINDIADFRDLTDPRQKERLSLQTQAIDTARNWVFHGGSVSPGEVCSSMALLILLLSTMKCNKRDLEALSKIRSYAEQLWQASLCSKSKYSNSGHIGVSLRTVTRTLLYGGLASFENLYRGLFYDIGDMHGLTLETQTQRSTNSKNVDVQSLVKRIREEIHKPHKNSLLAAAEGTSVKTVNKHRLLSSLDNLSRARNQLAHNELLTLDDVQQVLSDACHLINAFRLSGNQLKVTLQNVSFLQDEYQNSEETGMVNVTLQSSNSEKPSPGKHAGDEGQRILRPSCLHFVGREKELSLITEAFSQTNPGNVKSALFYGPPGIGKSYLANKVVHFLNEKYKIQVWLCCSSNRELQQDLSIHRHLFISGSSNPIPGKKQILLSSPGIQTNRQGLIVFDDVCSSTVRFVYDIILQTDYSAIITTRSTAVKECMSTKTIICPLEAFSEDESCKLIFNRITAREISDRFSVQKMKSVISDVLRNLPLCVSIYASLLCCALKTKLVEKIALSDCVNATLSKNWSEVEERFGDRFHVQGLTGVVQAAEPYLQSHPYAVFLLAKICSVQTESFDWDNIICKRESFTYIDSLHKSKYLGDNKLVRNVYIGLLGVLDFLFSDDGLETLEICRGDLEELGLITWEVQTRRVHIHALTLHTVQDRLEKRSLYIDSLISLFIGKLPELTVTRKLANRVSHVLRAELLLQVVITVVSPFFYIRKDRKGHVYTLNSDKNNRTEITEDKVYELIAFLEKIVRSEYCRGIFQNVLEAWHFDHLLVRLTGLLWKYGPSRIINLLSHVGINHYEFAVITDSLPELKRGFCIEVADRLIDSGFWEESLEYLKEALRLTVSIDGRNSALAATMHYTIAKFINLRKGPSAMNTYLKQAGESCPTLKFDPTNIIRERIRSFDAKAIDILFISETITLFRLARFQITGGFQITDGLSPETRECIALLTKNFDLILRAIAQHLERGQSASHARILNEINYYLKLQCLARFLAVTFLELRMPRKSVWCLLSVYLVIKDRISSFVVFLIQERDRSLWSEVDNYIAILNYCAVRCGFFSFAVTEAKQVDEAWKKELKAMEAEHLQGNPDSLELNVSETCVLTTVQNEHQTPKQPDYFLPGIISTEQLYKQFIVHFFEALFLCYEKRNLHLALTVFLTALNEVILLESREPGSDEMYYVTSESEDHIIIRHVQLLSLLLGSETATDVMSKLHSLIRAREECILLRLTILQAVHVERLNILHRKSQLCHLYRHHQTAKAAVEEDRLEVAQKAALRYWIAYAEHQVDLPTDLQKLNCWELPEILIPCSLLLDVAGFLKQSYMEKKNYEIVEWFAKFSIQLAKTMNFDLQSAKYAIEYVAFLKERERWAEALQQCYLVQQFLVDQFGEDYLSWLPDAPNVSLLRTDLEAETAENRLT